MVQTASLQGTQCVRVGVWQCNPTVLKAGYSVWNCLMLSALKISPGIIPGFLPSVTWPSLPKKNYNGLINQSSTCVYTVLCFVYVRHIKTNIDFKIFDETLITYASKYLAKLT